MPKRTKDQNSLYLGDWNAICDVCGFKFKASDLRKRWDGLMVCKDDYEKRHPMDFFKAPKESTSVPWNRVDSEEAGGYDILGNPFPPGWLPSILIQVQDISVKENAGSVDVTILINLDSPSDVTVDYATADNTAIAGTDYTETTGTATIAAGLRTTTVNIPIIDMPNPGSNRDFYLNLSNAVNATISDDQAVITILDTNNVSITVDPASYSITGSTSTSLYNQAVSASNGSYQITGDDADLYTDDAIYTLNGSYGITGSTATLTRQLAVSAGNGAYGITGSVGTLLKHYPLTAGNGSYQISGTTGTLQKTKNITAENGDYQITGSVSTGTQADYQMQWATFGNTADNTINRAQEVGGIASDSLTGLFACGFSVSSSANDSQEHRLIGYVLDKFIFTRTSAHKLQIVARNSAGTGLLVATTTAADWAGDDEKHTIAASWNMNYSYSGQSYGATNPCTVTVTGHGLSTGELVTFDNSAGGEIDGTHTVIATDANTLLLVGVDNSGGSGGTVDVYGRLTILMDGVVDNDNWTISAYDGASGNIDWSRDHSNGYTIGGDDGGSNGEYWYGCASCVMLDTLAYDLGNPINRSSIFYPNGLFRSPGSNGSAWLGYQPLWLFQNAAATFETNSGSDTPGDWSAPTTTLTSC